jgi:hypothetical protein
MIEISIEELEAFYEVAHAARAAIRPFDAEEIAEMEFIEFWEMLSERRARLERAIEAVLGEPGTELAIG